MSRRRASLQQLACNNPEPRNSQINLPDVDDKIPEQTSQNSIVGHLTSCFERVSLWFNTELGRTVFDDKAYESNKILPSVVSFILGLLLVKIYGDSLDSAITRCYGHLRNAFHASYGLLARLTSRDIEIITALCVLVLFWIGALRILFNLIRQLVQIPRFYSSSSS